MLSSNPKVEASLLTSSYYGGGWIQNPKLILDSDTPKIAEKLSTFCFSKFAEDIALYLIQTLMPGLDLEFRLPPLQSLCLWQKDQYWEFRDRTDLEFLTFDSVHKAFGLPLSRSTKEVVFPGLKYHSWGRHLDFWSIKRVQAKWESLDLVSERQKVEKAKSQDKILHTSFRANDLRPPENPGIGFMSLFNSLELSVKDQTKDIEALKYIILGRRYRGSAARQYDGCANSLARGPCFPFITDSRYFNSSHCSPQYPQAIWMRNNRMRYRAYDVIRLAEGYRDNLDIRFSFHADILDRSSVEMMYGWKYIKPIVQLLSYLTSHLRKKKTNG